MYVCTGKDYVSTKRGAIFLVVTIKKQTNGNYTTKKRK